LHHHGDQAKILAGGQSLIPLLNFRLAHPAVVVDVNRLTDLAYVRQHDGGVAVGALTRQHAVERSELVRARVPVVAEACRLIARAPTPPRGPSGGNPAPADPASERPAVMVALEAEMAVASRAGSRVIPAGQFFIGPLTPALRPGEMLTEIRIPAAPPRTG